MAKRFTTPRGTANYPKTDRGYKWSDSANRSVPDPDGEYLLDVVFTPEAAANITRVVNTFIKDNNLKAKKLPYKPYKDKEGNETGDVIVSFKQYAKNQDGTKRALPHFDSKAIPLPSSFQLTHGSTVIVSYRPFHYKAQGGGIKLYLDGVQVIELGERSNMFAPEDDGFTYVTSEADDMDNDFEYEKPTENDDDIPF